MDTLTKWFKALTDTVQEPTPYQAFQAGVTAGAVSMRTRAMDVLLESKSVSNQVINNIGQLPDIPKEG
jgi:hypothetical protein